MRWLLVVLLALGAWGEPRRVVSGEFEDVDLVFAIKVLAREMGRNVYIGPGVEGKVTLSLRSVPPEGALALMLGDEFDYKVVSNGKGGQTLIVAPPEKLATIPDDVFVNTADRPIPGCGVTRFEIQLHNTPAGPVQELLAIRYPNVIFTRHPTMNAFYIDGSREDKLAIIREIPKLDVYSEPPVRELVEVRNGDVAEVKALLATLVPDVNYEVNAKDRTLALDGSQGAVDQVAGRVRPADGPDYHRLQAGPIERVQEPGLWSTWPIPRQAHCTDLGSRAVRHHH